MNKKTNGLSLLVVECVANPAPAPVQWFAKRIDLGPDTPFHTYRKEAERLQNEFDADCDPVRVYVCEHGMPRHAAFQLHDRASAPPQVERRPRGRSH